MKILFVCKYNRFRSRVAEAYFRKINKNKKIKAESAGLIKGNPVSKTTIKAAKLFGLDIRGTPRGLSSKLLKNTDLLIIVADDVPKSLFNKNKNVVVWKVTDNFNENNIKPTIKEIKVIVKKINEFAKELK